MGKLTTHVLDTMHGKPAAGVKIELYSLSGERALIKSILTNMDGRCDEPVLENSEMVQGEWELIFYIGEYFAGLNIESGKTAFLNDVPVRFGIDDVEQHYHVPLLVSPWSYTTYRGS